MIAIRKIELPALGVEQLCSEAQAEGYQFLDTLLEDWNGGQNRFDGAGEILCGCVDGDLVVGVGGLNRDPYAAGMEVGRIRRVYVRRAWRNRGIGKTLVKALVDHARQTFRIVRLRAENPHAARLYEGLGFVPVMDEGATHVFEFEV